MRSKHSIENIKKNISDPYSIEKVLTDLDIEHLVKLFDSIEIYDDGRNRKIKKNTGPVTLDIKNYLQDDVVKKILENIKLYIGNFEITAGFFFKTDFPHVIHNDDTYELPDNVYKAITIPLKIYRKNDTKINPYLCFFDQFYFHGPSKFFNKDKNIETYYNRCIYDYSEVDGLVENKKIEPDFLFSHLKKEWLENLSLHSIIEWKPGSIIIFDSVRLHCASDFRKQGIVEKLGISIFTKKFLNECVVN